MLEIAESDIGGARVRMGFMRNGERLKAGTHLTAEEVIAIRLPNRRALIESNFLELYLKTPSGKRYIVGIGKDKYNVIEGRILNEEPLTRQQADKLVDEG